MSKDLTEQPIPSAIAVKCCGNCRHQGQQRMTPQDLTTQMICRHGPPIVIVIPTGPNGAQLNTIFPPTFPENFCGCFAPKMDG